MANLEEAQKFLTLLDESVSFHTFQTFDDVSFDDGRRRKNPDLVKIIHGDLEDSFNALETLNDRGAGVYVTVQEMDGNGRKSENLKTIRAIFQEDDGDGKKLPLDPHIIVNTSPGKYHRYILVEGLSADEFNAVMEVIVNQYGGDKNAKDLARVLRLPGFGNNKYGYPYPVTIVHESGDQPFNKQDVLEAFGIDKVEKREEYQSTYDGSQHYVTESTIRDLRSALTHLDYDDTATWHKVGLALKTIGDIGRDLWVEWSKRSDKWNEDNIRQWKTFKPTHLTYTTIFYMAAESGWINPMSEEEVYEDPEEDYFKDLKAIFASELPVECEFPDELVEGLLVRNEFSILYGDSNSGKTFFAIDIACAVSLGINWMGRRTESGIVVYLASESPASVRLRLQAYEKHNGVALGNNFLIVQAPVNFYESDGDVIRLSLLLKKVSQLTGNRIEMIIGDTLARISSGANENAGEDMGLVMKRFDELKDSVNAHIMIISHSGKDATKGLRGWSGIKAHVDTEIEVKEKEGIRTATVTKQRGLAGKGDQILYALKVVEMGVTKWGTKATTCVVTEIDPSSVVAKEKDPYAWETMILIDAWSRDGYAMVNNTPHINRKSIRESIHADKPKISPASVSNKMGKFKKMTSDGLLEEYNFGWLVIDGMLSSQLIVYKQGHSHL